MYQNNYINKLWHLTFIKREVLREGNKLKECENVIALHFNWFKTILLGYYNKQTLERFHKRVGYMN